MRTLLFCLLLATGAFAESATFNTTITDTLLSYDVLRERGELDNSFGKSGLHLCNNEFKCRQLGTIDERNLIHWNDDVTMDELKKMIQATQDFTTYQVNQMRKRERQK